MTIRWPRAVALLCSLLAVTTSALAQSNLAKPNGTGPYQAPTYCESDLWMYAYGEKRTVMRHRVERVADGLVEMDSATIAFCAGCRVIFDRNLVLKEMRRADGTPIPLAAERKYWEFPLEVGKTWQYTARADFDRTGGARNGPSNRTDVSIRVEAFEDVTVPAGTFRAFRTRKDYYALTPGDFAVRATRWSQLWWFAPAVKWVVKYTSTRPGEQEWELTSYRLSCQP